MEAGFDLGNGFTVPPWVDQFGVFCRVKSFRAGGPLDQDPFSFLSSREEAPGLPWACLCLESHADPTQSQGVSTSGGHTASSPPQHKPC